MPGLAIDVYAGWPLIHDYGAGESALIESASVLRGLGFVGVYGVDRPRGGRAAAGMHLAGERAPDDATEVVEHGLRYPVHLADGPATGLYLDQRDNRPLVARWTGQGRLLNTFAYTGSFSLVAAAGGGDDQHRPLESGDATGA